MAKKLGQYQRCMYILYIICLYYYIASAVSVRRACSQEEVKERRKKRNNNNNRKCKKVHLFPSNWKKCADGSREKREKLYWKIFTYVSWKSKATLSHIEYDFIVDWLACRHMRSLLSFENDLTFQLIDQLFSFYCIFLITEIWSIKGSSIDRSFCE